MSRKLHCSTRSHSNKIQACFFRKLQNQLQVDCASGAWKTETSGPFLFFPHCGSRRVSSFCNQILEAVALQWSRSDHVQLLVIVIQFPATLSVAGQKSFTIFRSLNMMDVRLEILKQFITGLHCEGPTGLHLWTFFKQVIRWWTAVGVASGTWNFIHIERIIERISSLILDVLSNFFLNFCRGSCGSSSLLSSIICTSLCTIITPAMIRQEGLACYSQNCFIQRSKWRWQKVSIELVCLPNTSLSGFDVPSFDNQERYGAL